MTAKTEGCDHLFNIHNLPKYIYMTDHEVRFYTCSRCKEVELVQIEKQMKRKSKILDSRIRVIR